MKNKKKISLEGLKWGVFQIDSIFEVKRVTGSKIDNYNDGIYPYVTTSAENNGITTFVDAQTSDREDSNTLSINPITAVTFYHGYEYVGRGGAGSSIYTLKSGLINKYSGLFVANMIMRTAKHKASYGVQLNGERLKQTKFLLPINKDDSPDWQFMEDYIKQEQKEMVKKIISFYESKKTMLTEKTLEVNCVNWKEFKVGEIFDFKRQLSKGLNHLKSSTNGISYLGATNRNNGVLTFVEPEPKAIYKGNSVAFIRNGEGSIGYSIYKAEDFIATQDISVGYNKNLNRYSGMFITTIADKVRGKYNFGYKRNQKRLESEILQLPSDHDGNPDWDYMSRFMYSIEAEKVSEIISYFQKSKLSD